MDAVSLLRDQIVDARGLFEATLADVTPEQAGWLPAGRALPIAAHLAHVLASQDVALHGLLAGTAPLVATTWAGRAGFAEPPPFGPGQSWDGWARATRFDLAALRAYGARRRPASHRCPAPELVRRELVRGRAPALPPRGLATPRSCRPRP